MDEEARKIGVMKLEDNFREGCLAAQKIILDIAGTAAVREEGPVEAALCLGVQTRLCSALLRGQLFYLNDNMIVLECARMVSVDKKLEFLPEWPFTQDEMFNGILEEIGAERMGAAMLAVSLLEGGDDLLRELSMTLPKDRPEGGQEP